MAIINFTIHIDDPAEVAIIFDRIQVWRSATELGTYSEITDNSETAATVDGTVEGPWNLNGQTLTIIVNGADPQSVVFAGTNPLSLEDVIDQINDVFPGLASELPTDTEKIRLRSTIVGTQSIIEASGTAAATLGLSTLHTNGKSARPLISSNTEEYVFHDYDGQDDYWYKTRYVSTVTGAVSTFSTTQQLGSADGLSGSLVVVGKVALADASGHPIAGRRVIIVPVAPQVIADGQGNNYGVLPSVERIIATTDSNGRATITLVKGQRIKVFLEGTTFQREFVVPNTDFDILTVASTQPDPLNIVAAPPMPIRV